MFDRIRNLVFPHLLEEHTKNQPIQIWSAATASGEEAISIAMMAHERMPDNMDISILGTDISYINDSTGSKWSL